MSLKNCTLTGIDENTSLDNIRQMSDKFPFVEWGVLFNIYLGTQRPRYPSLKWIKKLTQTHSDLNLSLHLCGSLTITAFFQRDLIDLCKSFKRIQINAYFDQYPASPELIKRCFSLISPTEIIIQHNNDSKGIMKLLGEVNNYSILFDSSRGAGISPQNWPNYIPSFYCGYAGGLGPDNIKSQLPLIESASQGFDYWIDMETKIRTIFEMGSGRDNESCIDFEKVEYVLNAVEKHKEKGLLEQPFPEGDMSLLFTY